MVEQATKPKYHVSASRSGESVEEVYIIDSQHGTRNGRRPTMEGGATLPQRFLPSRGGSRPRGPENGPAKEESTTHATVGLEMTTMVSTVPLEGAISHSVATGAAVPPVEAPDIEGSNQQVGKLNIMNITAQDTNLGVDHNQPLSTSMLTSNDESPQMIPNGSGRKKPAVKTTQRKDLDTDDEDDETKSNKETQEKAKPALLQTLVQQMDAENTAPTGKMTPEQAIAKLLSQATKSGDKPIEGARPTAALGPRKGTGTVSPFSVVSKLKKWTTKTKAVSASMEKYPGHIQDVRDRGKQEKTQLPLPSMILAKEEALPIVHNIAKAYKVSFGKHHKLTQEAFARYEELKKELNGSDVFL